MTAKAVKPERWLSAGMLVLMPAVAAMVWALEPTVAGPADVLLAVMVSLPISAGFLAPVALPSLATAEAVIAGLYALGAILCCGSFALWLEVRLYMFLPPSSAMLAACIVSLVVYGALSGWAFARAERFLWGWGAAIAFGITTWLAVLLLLVL